MGVRADRLRTAAAHYAGVRALDEGAGPGDERDLYLRAFVRALGVDRARVLEASQALLALWTRPAIGLWRLPVGGAQEGLQRLASRDVKLGVVSNSDGTVEEQLRRSRLCQIGVGDGVAVLAIVDSYVIGMAKPDPAIFSEAVARMGVRAERSIYVGDSLRYDVRGAEAAGLRPLHFDPYQLCSRADGHRHVRSLLDVEEVLLNARPIAGG